MRPLKFGVTEYDTAQAYPGFTMFGQSGGRDLYLTDIKKSGSIKC